MASRGKKRKLEPVSAIKQTTKKYSFELSTKGKKRLEHIKQKNQPLIDFLKSEECLDYLKAMKKGEVESELHESYMKGSCSQRRKMMHTGFGPIADDDQVDEVLAVYNKLLQSMGLEVTDWLHYVFDVWLPEAIVLGLRKLKKYSKKKAWEMFHKGIKITNEDRELLHKSAKKKR